MAPGNGETMATAGGGQPAGTGGVNASPSGAWFRRIGDRILLVAVVSALVPLVIIGTMVSLKVRHDLINQAIEAQQSVTGAILHSIGATVQASVRQVQMMAQDPAMQSMEREAQVRTMYRFLDLNTLYYSFFVYRADGTTNAIAYRSRYRGDDERYINKRNILRRSTTAALQPIREAFLEAVRTNRAIVCEQVVTNREQTMLMIMVPINRFHDPDEVVGMISCAINVENAGMQDLVQGYPLSGGEVLALVDGEGRLLARRGSALPEGLAALGFDRARVRAEKTLPADLTLGDAAYLGVIAAVPELNGFILIARPRGEVLAFLQRLLLNLALALMVAVVLALSLSVVLARSLAGKVGGLLAGIRQVRDGIVSHRVEVEGEDELAEACAAFNDMVATLEKHRLMDEIWAREWRP